MKQGYVIEIYKVNTDSLEVIDGKRPMVGDRLIPIFIDSEDYSKASIESLGGYVKRGVELLEEILEKEAREKLNGDN